MKTKDKVHNLILRDIEVIYKENQGKTRNAIYNACMAKTGYSQRKCILLVKEYEHKIGK